MTDINANIDRETGAMSEQGQRLLSSDPDEMLVAFIELLFFAYRDFTGEPDAILQEYGFGRAHHRALHFVHHNPGLSVAELLKILKITKQSLARVLKQLIADGFIEQKPGADDRRRRLLYVTERGKALALELAAGQSQRIQAALQHAGPQANAAVSSFLLSMVAPQNRASVVELIGAANLAIGLNDADQAN